MSEPSEEQRAHNQAHPAQPPPPSAPHPARTAQHTRWVLLIISLTLLIGGALLKVAPLVEAGSRDFVGGTLFKVGMVVGLAWLAAPQLERMRWERMRWTGLAIIIFIGVLTAVRPRFGAMAAALVFGGFFVLAMLGWVRGVIFSGGGGTTIDAKSRKIEKNPTRR